MHSNARRNLRTLLTGFANNIAGSSLTPSEAKLYMDAIKALNGLLKYVSTLHPDGRIAEYQLKFDTIIDCLMDYGASDSEVSFGYHSDQSLMSPTSPYKQALRGDYGSSLEMNELKQEKLKLEACLHRFPV